MNILNIISIIAASISVILDAIILIDILKTKNNNKEDNLIIKEEEIFNKFEDVNLFITIEKSDQKAILYDISLYEKNHIIGLTRFAQEQELNEFTRMYKEMGFSQEDIDMIINEIVIIPHSTVYQLKNGDWLWELP